MAEKLMLFYKYVTEVKGLNGQMALAMETKLPTTKAAMAPDSPANLDLFKKAYQKVTGKPAPAV